MYRDEPRSLDERVAAIEERLRQPAGVYIPVAIMDAKGDLVVGLAPDNLVRLGAGLRGSLLTPDPDEESGLLWLEPGTDAWILVADSTQPSGLRWAPLPNPFAVVDAKGDLIAGTANDVVARLPVGVDGQILYADSSQAVGMRWGAPPAPVIGPPPPAGFGAVGVAIVNESANISNADCATIAAACEAQLVNHLSPAWNLEAATVTFYSDPAGVPGGAWVIHMVDTFDPGAAGWHSADPPYGHINVAEILAGGWGIFTSGFGVSIVTSHEICEMYVDPHVQMLSSDGVNRGYSVEVADPVESDSYSLGGVPVSDFALPSWFDPWSFTPPFSWAGNAPAPFTIAAGGYITYADLGAGHQIGPAVLPARRRLERVVFHDDLPVKFVEHAQVPTHDYWKKEAEVVGSRSWLRRHVVGGSATARVPPPRS